MVVIEILIAKLKGSVQGYVSYVGMTGVYLESANSCNILLPYL